MNSRITRIAKGKATQLQLAIGYTINRVSVQLYCLARRLMTRSLYTFEPDHHAQNLLSVQQMISSQLKAQRKHYGAMRYAYGYPYQALHALRVYGARSTEDRWIAYDLVNLVQASDHILDIGANCGFMSLYSVLRTGCRANCVDINPYMLNIGRHCAEVLQIDNRMNFIESTVDDFSTTSSYSIIFSFAAHRTEDGQHHPDLCSYLHRLASWLSPGGVVVFETHGYPTEKAAIRTTLDSIDNVLTIDRHLELFGGKRDLFLLRKSDDAGLST